jgi:hypothetical protein
MIMIIAHTIPLSSKKSKKRGKRAKKMKMPVQATGSPWLQVGKKV